MIYKAIIRKKVRYVRVYNILNRIDNKTNFMTKVMLGLVKKFSSKKGDTIE